LAHEGLGSVVVALAVELTRTDQRVPCLIVLGHGLAQQTPAPAKQQDRKKPEPVKIRATRVPIIPPTRILP
jgi:hypothetical protein